jgi:hypothetical protein
MSKIPQTPNMTIIPVNFRWPVKQIGDTQIVVEIPTLPLGTPVVTITEDAMITFRLSDKEVDKAFHAAQDAVLRAIMILE